MVQTAAAALIQPLAPEFQYATGAALKRKNETIQSIRRYMSYITVPGTTSSKQIESFWTSLD